MNDNNNRQAALIASVSKTLWRLLKTETNPAEKELIRRAILDCRLIDKSRV